MKTNRTDALSEFVSMAHRLQKRNRRARRLFSVTEGLIVPAFWTAALISIVRTLGPRRTGRLLAVAGTELARSRRG